MIPMFVRSTDYQLPSAADYAGAYRHRHLGGKTEEEIGIPPMHVWRTWENTSTDTAYYLGATAYQYRCTGDPAALQICTRTLGALKYIHGLGVQQGGAGLPVQTLRRRVQQPELGRSGTVCADRIGGLQANRAPRGPG